MKFIHLLPVLALAGTIGATHELSGSWGAPAEAAPAQVSVVPPWLRGEGVPAVADVAGGDAHPDVCSGLVGVAADGTDPHAALCADRHPHGDDAHAGVHASDDPHAGVHASDDPHAGLHDHGDDPHAGVHAGDDPHAGLHDHGDDPHAGVYAGGADPHAGIGGDPHADPAIHATVAPGAGDAYERVGLAPAPEVPLPAKIERSSAPNGRSVAQVFAERSALADQRVRVRGTVVKLNEGILGKTYLHLRDGSGSAERGDDDLTVTTTEAFRLGETVEVEGLLAIDQDVGAGYTYSALLTSAARVAP